MIPIPRDGIRNLLMRAKRRFNHTVHHISPIPFFMTYFEKSEFGTKLHIFFVKNAN